MLVSRFMTRKPVTVGPATSIDEAIRLMEQHGFRHLPVAAGDDVLGMLSDRDVRLGTGGRQLAGLGLPGESGLPVRVEQIMHAPVICVEATERGPSAAKRMIEQRIGALPVLAGGKLAGIVTETNLVSAFRDLCRDPGHADAIDRPVEELMHSLVVTLSPDDTVDEAVRRCTDWRIRHVPVLRDEELVGMVSDRDIRLAIGRALVEDALASDRGGAPTGPVRVESIMSRELVTVEPAEALSRAVSMMLQHRVSALPVMLDGMLLGIVTRTDVLEHYASVA